MMRDDVPHLKPEKLSAADDQKLKSAKAAIAVAK